MMRKSFIILAIILFTGLTADAQDSIQSDTTTIEPIESARLQGPREATDAEKEYARMLADEREQQQIYYNLPPVDENGSAMTNSGFYYPWFGWNEWQLHKGLNVNLGASVFANFGGGGLSGAGFTQDVSLMYVSNLSKKATLAVGGYLNNMIYRGDNYTVAGLTALFGYRFNEHWSAYAFVQKAFHSNNVHPVGFGYYGYPYASAGFSPYWGGYGLGYGYMGYTPWNNRLMDRIGGGVTYQWGDEGQNSISIQVEYDHMPEQNHPGYNFRRYDYPVR